MVSEPRRLRFRPDDLGDIALVMDAMAAVGKGWVNLEPDVDPDDLPPRGTGLFGIFSGRGPDVPLATWTAPTTSRRGKREPAMVGLQHGLGNRVKKLLQEAGTPVPEGWRVVQDYVKKGLVVAVPPGVSSEDVARWLISAAAATASVPTGGDWSALVYDG